MYKRNYLSSLPCITYTSAEELENALVRDALKGSLILTATGRLSRRILHLFRIKKIEQREGGWKTPAIYSFKRWVKDTFNLLWMPYRPLSRTSTFNLWQEAAQQVPPPEGVELTPSLYEELENAFEILTSYQKELTGSSELYPLIDWRKKVTNHFLKLLNDRFFISWAGILGAVTEAILQNRVRLPEEVSLAGFDELSPVEEHLIQSLMEKCSVKCYQPSLKSLDGLKVRVFATPEQECQAICAEVLNTWNQGKTNLGIVFFEEDYFNLLRQCLEDLTDREPKPLNALRYNLTMGTPLSEHPLFQTALLPLRLLNETAFTFHLSSLLSSPYVGKHGEDWDENLRKILWNSENLMNLEETLSYLLRANFPVTHLKSLSTYQIQPLKVWVETLKALWDDLEFPYCTCETDTLAQEHLFILLKELEKEMGQLRLSSKELQLWLLSLSKGIEVVEKTPEIAGIQILKSFESRGLSFDLLWVVGVHGNSLPEPVKEFPLLDPEERKLIKEGTIEGQYEAGLRTLTYLLLAAPEVRFSRAASSGEEKPYLECPLIPDEPFGKNQHSFLDLFYNPPEEWIRARWLREGLYGLSKMQEVSNKRGVERVDCLLPRILNVSTLETLLSCPFKYFAQNLLGLEPLEVSKIDISPRERGDTIHLILSNFITELQKAAFLWPEDKNGALDLLSECVDKVLKKKPRNLFWSVERTRLLGNGNALGILSLWLLRERERALKGWKFDIVEKSFEGLRIGDSQVFLKGKVDRIDFHPLEGIIIWDYKTGELPSSHAVFKEMIAPQLPAYLLALKRNLISSVRKKVDKITIGYIHLKSASQISFFLLKYNEDLDKFLKVWEGTILKKIKNPLNGLYLPEPNPSPAKVSSNNACTHCEYYNLCNYSEDLQKDQGS